MSYKFLSDAWAKEVEKTLIKELAAEKSKLNTSLNSQFLKCPDGKTRFFHMAFKDGAVDNLKVVENNPPAAEFTITADYKDFADLFSYKLPLQDAISGGKFKLDGNMIQVMSIVPGLQGIIKSLSGVETTF